MSCTRVFIPYQMQIVSCKLLLLGLLNPQLLSLDHQPVQYLKFKYCSSLNYYCSGNVQNNPVMKATHLQLSAKLKYGKTAHSPYPLGCHEYLSCILAVSNGFISISLQTIHTNRIYVSGKMLWLCQNYLSIFWVDYAWFSPPRTSQTTESNRGWYKCIRSHSNHLTFEPN